MARETILIVEDEEEIQELLHYNLSKDGFRSIGVLSGEDRDQKSQERALRLHPARPHAPRHGRP